MNTGDHADVKVEQYATYKIQTLYYLINPDGVTVNSTVYGNSDVIKISLFDFSYASLYVGFTATVVLMFI